MSPRLRRRVELARWVVVAAFWGVECLKAVDRALARPHWTEADEEAFRIWQQSA